jgi:alkaline phosphatase
MQRIKNALFVVVVLTVLVGAASAQAGDAKNVILLISDGMGFGSLMAADYYTGEQAVYENFNTKYFMSTYSDGGSYDPTGAVGDFDYWKGGATDSAAAATAMATGQKTYDGAIGVDTSGNPLTTIVEHASSLGKATGVVTSVEFSHATPAGMVAHNTSRNNYAEIANEMIYNSDLDVIMGAGHPEWINGAEYSGNSKYVGGDGTFSDISAGTATAKDGQTWTYIEDKADFEALAASGTTPDKVLGLAMNNYTLQQGRDGDGSVVNTSNMVDNVPTLETMTKGALNALDNDKDGFFLMVEGGAVDWANHANQDGRTIEEQMDFNNTVQAVVDWIENNSSWDETLVIVTADHECGYLWGPEASPPDGLYGLVEDNGEGNMPGMGYFSGDHSNMLVPLYAKGAGSEMFAGLVDGSDLFMAGLISDFDPAFTGEYVDNTDIFNVMSSSMSRPVPVPAAAWLLGSGLLGLMGLRRRFQS